MVLSPLKFKVCLPCFIDNHQESTQATYVIAGRIFVKVSSIAYLAKKKSFIYCITKVRCGYTDHRRRIKLFLFVIKPVKGLLVSSLSKNVYTKKGIFGIECQIKVCLPCSKNHHQKPIQAICVVSGRIFVKVSSMQ